jgi:hypothetical protein
MNRRSFVSASASAGLAASAAPAAGKPSLFEISYIRLRNGSQVQKTNDFVGKALMPALQRAGAGPMGFFGAVIAEQSPFVMSLISFPSFDAVLETRAKMAEDKAYQAAADAYNSLSELSYMRIENSLLRGFPGFPHLVAPPSEGGRAPRIFELRTYESNNAKAGRSKIGMFDKGEAGIFKRLGMNPVFFGETIIGRNIPNLTYMLAYDSLAQRDEMWKKFGSDPEWQKMRSVPEWADALIVSNISNSILRPLPFSPIR